MLLFNRIRRSCCLLLLSFAATGCSRAPEPGLIVYSVPSTVRIDRDARSSFAADLVDLAAARDEYEGFQLVLESTLTNDTVLDVRISNLEHISEKEAVAATNFIFSRLYYLNVLQASAGIPWIPLKEYPGPLLPFYNPYSEGKAAWAIPFDLSRIGNAGTPYIQGRRNSGFLFSSGIYTGTTRKAFVIQIDRGGAPGQATFRWSSTYKKGLESSIQVKRWEQESVPIPSLEPDGKSAPVNLCDGVTVRFAYDQDTLFEKGQAHHFTAYPVMNEVVWGEVHIPDGTAPGTYTGSVDVILTSGMKSLPVRLNVFPFSIAERTIATAFHGWMEPRFFKDNPPVDERFERLQHQHRIDCQMIHGHRTSWINRPSGIDWKSFEEAASARLGGSFYGDGKPMLRFHPGMYTPGNERHFRQAAKASPENVKHIARQMANYFKDRGWFDRMYLYCKDEPRPADIPGIVRDIRLFKEADPDWAGRFMVTTRPAQGSPLLDEIDIWCVKYHWWIDPDLKASLIENGATFWNYVSNLPQSPNPTYHTDGLQGYEPRIIKWAAWLNGAEGFLYWASVLNQDYPNPWTTPMTSFGVCGDGSLFYYGARNGERLSDHAVPMASLPGPIPGYRLKQIRDGFEDWEYLKRCEQKHGRTFTEKLAREVYRDPGGAYGEKRSAAQLDASWTQDPMKLLEVRRKLAEAISN